MSDTMDMGETAVAVVIEDGDGGEEVLAEASLAASAVPPATTSTPAAAASSSSGSSKKSSKKKTVVLSKVDAARAARDMLVHSVRRLPMELNETCTLRSFGRLQPKQTNYNTPNALYPIGFSCDRFEFSPAHGRIIKLRCNIIDGQSTNNADKSNSPLFRISWGPGIDEDHEGDYPFDAAQRSGADGEQPLTLPVEGMRVRVRYDEGNFSGTIVDVGEEELGSKRSSTSRYDIRIQYDDGSLEDAVIPDPDIVLYLPGSEDAMVHDGVAEVSEVNGKPVSSVIGSSPIDAWGKALTKLGLVDDITVSRALIALGSSREAGEAKAKDKLDSKTKSPSKKGTATETKSGDGAESKEEGAAKEEPPEEISEEEEELQAIVDELKAELEVLQKEDREAASELADARTGLLGPFLCNPFQKGESSSSNSGVYSQETLWLSQVVRKEKLKMGSTGPRKKIVTATDLLERNNTFFDGDVEALIEGLPGSEFCENYVFQASRAHGAASMSQQWIHEAKLRQERMAERAKKKAGQAAKAKSDIQRKKEQKRKARDDQRDARKKQKQEELDDKKKARAEERMARLKVQVEQRLFKDASQQREKVVTFVQKVLGREFSRRRKAAELVSSQVAADEKHLICDSGREMKLELPLIRKVYDEDVLCMWDFVSNSFGDAFLKWGYLKEIPSLDELQGAIDALRDGVKEPRTGPTELTRHEAVDLLTELAIAICKPIAVSLTRFLFTSLIALHPALQKDFGAAFFAEVRSNADVTETTDGPSATDLLPVTPETWQEIVRLSVLSNAAVELGLSKQESAHLLRGYRSSGHPNSREAKRLRKNEDHFTTCLRMRITREARSVSTGKASKKQQYFVRLPVPAVPSSYPSEWSFHLNNILTLPASKTHTILKNIESAMKALKDETGATKESLEAVLTKAKAAFEKASKVSKPSESDLAECRTAVESLSPFLVRESDSSQPDCETEKSALSESVKRRQLSRSQVGLVAELGMSRQLYKEALHSKEKYMESALQLKKEMNDDDDDDDEEENGKVADEQKGGKAENETEVVATVVKDVKDVKDEASTETKSGKIGKPTPYDDFAGDIPEAPELLRRCLALLRNLCSTGPADPFIYPVDPQTNPGYYESVLRPMCLREVGKQLQASAKRLVEGGSLNVATVVAQFARNIRLVIQNCSCYGNAGPMIIAGGDEMSRIFERLLLDWVLAPTEVLPKLELLDDEKCVEVHESDDDSVVLLCDSCEGKYNLGRLDPPLESVPKGDWFCPRCVNARSWESIDPRIGMKVKKDVDGVPVAGTILSHSFVNNTSAADSAVQLRYNVGFAGRTLQLPLSEVDTLLAANGTPVKPVICVQAISESVGYGRSIDRGLYHSLFPVPLNPCVAEVAAKISSESSAYRDMLHSSCNLLLANSEDFGASEWLRVLNLLLSQCSSSEMMLSLASKMEGDAAEKMATLNNEASKKRHNIAMILPSTKADEEMEESDIEPNVNGSGQSNDAVMVNASAIEVVSNQKVEQLPSTQARLLDANAAEVRPDQALSEEAVEAKVREAARKELERRSKAREDGFVAHSIKAMLKPTISSFEEDTLSGVVDRMFNAKDGLGLSSSITRGRGCDFCGLSDVALGAPLVRAPSALEWRELMPHASKGRRTLLVADLRSGAIGNDQSALMLGRAKSRPLVSVKVRVGDELFSWKDEDTTLDGRAEGEMMEFLPRNEVGFQAEIEFRDGARLPFMTGSISAHECCAVAAHNARKEQLIIDFEEKRATLAELDTGILCGRTLPLGMDGLGRSYWKFKNDNALFIQHNDTWYCYSEPAIIAGIVAGLGAGRMAGELKRQFPEAARLSERRRWAHSLQERQVPLLSCLALGKKTSSPLSDVPRKHGGGSNQVFQEGEDVLVVSTGEKLLWDARIVSVNRQGNRIVAYQVHYPGWSSRYNHWVSANRLVARNNRSLQEQKQLQSVIAEGSDDLCETLTSMRGFKHYESTEDRVRADRPINLAAVANLPEDTSVGDKAFALTKAAILLIEGALPTGSINNLPSGAWNPTFAAGWRKAVRAARGPATLLGCLFLLEETLEPDWIEEQVAHVLSCLPLKWKSIQEATVSTIALRVSLLDQGLKYDVIDKSKFRSKSRKSS